MSNVVSPCDTLVSHLLQPKTDFALCIKCQIPEGVLVRNPQPESYAKFLESVRHRAEIGDGEFPAVSHRLCQYTAEDLVGNATWHKNCYKDTINSHKIDRAQKAYERKLSASSDDKQNTDKENTDHNVACERPFTRSSCPSLTADNCFFCNEGSDKGVLHEVTSFNVGRQIREVVELSNNRQWQVKLQPLNPDDARSVDIKYHLYCYVKYVQRSGSSPCDLPVASYDDCIREACVDTEFISILRNMLTDGTFVSMDTVRGIYEQLMLSNGLNRTYVTKEVKAKVLKYMTGEVEFARPYVNRPETICSSASKNAAVCDAAAAAIAENPQQDVLTIMNCAAIVRRDILRCAAQKWEFNFTVSQDKTRVPVSLQMLLKWIMQGTGSSAEVCNEEIERTSFRLAQNVMYSTKSNRQVSYQRKNYSHRFNHSRSFENEQVLAVALKVHASTRSRSLIQYLHRNGHCVSYGRLMVLEAELAKSVMKNMASDKGIYIPPKLIKSVPVFYAVDNIDFDEDTADGKHTLHGTVLVAFQALTTTAENPVVQTTDQSSTVNYQATAIPPDSYLRHLRGSVVPKGSSKYKDYSCNNFADVEEKYHEVDTVWLTSRCIARQSDLVLKQPIPLWAGYNSLVTSDDRPITTVQTLPLLKSPANEYNTLIDVLQHAQQITTSVMGVNKKTVITFDMDLYIRVIKLQSLRPDLYSNYVFRVGEFHTVLCSLRAIGSYIENSGIDDAWVESDVYGPTTCRQILEGKHMKRALDAHVTTVQVLFDLTMELFSADHAAVCEQLYKLRDELLEDGVDKQFLRIKHIHTTMTEFLKLNMSPKFEAFVTQRKGRSSMFSFFWSYMELVETLLNFIRASRQGLWLLHLSSLEKLCGVFFCQNRLKYAQYIPEYIAKMQQLETTDPFIWHEFMEGNFCVKKSSVAFSSIGVDHAIEHVNRSMKVMGGIRGITQKPAALSRFFLIAPELARLSQEAEAAAGYSEEGRTKHHDLTPAAVHNQEQRIAKLKQYISDNNPLKVDGHDLMNFVTNCVLPEQVTADIMKALAAGSEAYQNFTTERIVGDVSLWERMRRMKLKNWTSAGQRSEVKVRRETIELKENRSLFARLALAAVSRPEIDMADSIGTYEFSCISRALFATDGSLLPCTGKSQLMNILEEYSEQSHTASQLPLQSVEEQHVQSVTAVIDGMVVVQELAATATVRTCREIADKFLAAIARRTEHYSTFHIVFDNYTVKNSLKQTTRDKRNSGLQCREYICADNTPVKESLHKFLSSVSTKHSLTVYLASQVLEHYAASEKTCIVATSEGAQSTRGDVSRLSSNHEEADTMLILHAVYASENHQDVHIMSPDTDVFILALRRLPQLGPHTCVINGIGSKRKLVFLQPIYDALGSDVIAALPGFHAFTGCDITGRFAGKGKKSCWKVFVKARKGVIRAFSKLGQGQWPGDEDYHFFEEFVCRLYQPKTKETSVSRLRWNMFKQSQAEAERLPPTPAALRQHTLRAHYQCMIWCSDIIPIVDLPDPTSYGWCSTDGQLTPTVTNLKPAPEAIVELV